MTAAAQDTCHLVQPGLMDYQAAWDIQRRLAAARGLGRLSDTLILLEHPHTYTLGRSAHAENLLLDENDRQRLGIALVEVDRGGDITYHGPGQMVAYPIRYLGRVDTEGRLAQVDYVGYLRSLEEALIRTLACFGIGGHREAGYTGVWVATSAGLAKIAAIGVRVSAQGVSTHGAALNVTTDLEYFRGIIPCGIADRPVTSMQMMMGDAVPDLAEVQYAFAQSFAGVFGYQALVPSELAALLS